MCVLSELSTQNMPWFKGYYPFKCLKPRRNHGISILIKSELKDHKKCEHNPLSEIQCPVCSRTFATDEEHEDHKPCSSCGECGVCFTSDYNYFLHHLQLHQDEFQLGMLPGFTQSYSNSMKQSYANGARCPCAICYMH